MLEMRVSYEESLPHEDVLWRPCYFRFHLDIETLMYSFDSKVSCSRIIIT